MTRINIGILPAQLCDKHLIAEHREIKRIPNTIKSGKAIVKNIPAEFTLGIGHVKFFYDKLLYLKNRYISLYEECIKRGFKVTNYIDAWEDLPLNLMNDYSPTERDIAIVWARIQERLQSINEKEAAKKLK